jgi:exodeoxyribonuclease V alpha subunit
MNAPMISPLVQSARVWLANEAPALPSDLHAAVEALYEAVEAGHVCIRVTTGNAAAWYATEWVGTPGAYCPFILDDNGRFYLARYHSHESGVAAALKKRAENLLSPSDPAALGNQLNALFPSADPDDRQRLAALLAQFKPLTLVSGGPGTGKTTTVVKLLALLQAQAGDTPLHILLAAPTGKAAQRLSESIRGAKEKLPVAEGVKAAIPEQAQTLHRLLGAQGDTGRYRHTMDNPLSCDVLLIDEASMIDLAMMHAVLKALPETARLILLGDRDQLASVEAGSVFGDLCMAQGMSHTLAEQLSPFGVTLPSTESNNPMADCRVELVRSYRFSTDSGIGIAARASREGEADTLLQALASSPDLSRCDGVHLGAQLEQGYATYRDAARQGDPASAFAAFLRFRVLCAHRQGAAGVEGLNALMETGRSQWYAGRPIIIRTNDYALRLFNGDIGLCLPTAEGLRVFFETAPGGYRALAPGRLPAHESAWAMTVHQSQGSEFDEVLLVLPDVVTPVLDRPLIYTAVTRAKSRFVLCGAEGVLKAALGTLPKRESGLVDKLAGV